MKEQYEINQQCPEIQRWFNGRRVSIPLITPTAERSRTVHGGERIWWKSLFITQGCGKLRPEDCELCGKPELQRESLSQTNQVSSRPTSKQSTNNHTVCLSAPISPLQWSLHCCSSGACQPCFVRQVLLLGPGPCPFRLDWWPVSPALFLSPVLCHKACNHEPHAWFLTRVQDPRLGPSRLLCKQFAN